MSETKHKPYTSTEVKNRYNQRVYDQINFKIPKKTAAKFKAKCEAKNIPQAQVLKKAIDDFLNE